MADNLSTNKEQHSTTLYDLMQCVLLDQRLETADKKELLDELRKNSGGADDRWTYRWAIWILGAAVLAAILFVALLTYKNYEVPEMLVTIASTLAGGLLGIVSPGRGNGAVRD